MKEFPQSLYSILYRIWVFCSSDLMKVLQHIQPEIVMPHWYLVSIANCVTGTGCRLDLISRGRVDKSLLVICHSYLITLDNPSISSDTYSLLFTYCNGSRRCYSMTTLVLLSTASIPVLLVHLLLMWMAVLLLLMILL